MCEHCLVMDNVLTDLIGAKVSKVIMSRLIRELHGPKTSTMRVLAPEITLEPVPHDRLPSR